MNKFYYNKTIENFYDRYLPKIKKDLDEYYTLCLRFNELVDYIGRTGFHYDEQNNVFDIAELFIAHHLKEYGINTNHIVNKIKEE